MYSTFRADFIREALIGCVGITICIPIGIYVLFAMTDSFVNGCTSRELNTIEEMGRFNIPETASNIDACYFAWQSYRLDAQFEIHPSVLETFIQSTNIDLPLATTGKPAQFWKWDKDADHVENYLYGKYVGSFTQEVLVDTGNPERYVVYIWVLGGD